MKHESPLEHAYATFHIQDISRAASHQLVRHRLTAISQKSQRYVNESNFNYVIPDGVDKDKFKEDMDTIKGIYNRMIQEGAKKEDARAILPNACTTELILSANFRELRHIINVRSHHTAQSEIREVSNRMLELLLDICKPAFEDLSGR
jgi:thymidylate synthase (FAD)